MVKVFGEKVSEGKMLDNEELVRGREACVK